MGEVDGGEQEAEERGEAKEAGEDAGEFRAVNGGPSS